MDTIFANVMPIMKSAISVIRISGPQARQILDQCIKTTRPEPRQASLLNLYHPKTGHMIDRALVIYFQSPHSFTGEDVVELHLHGSIGVTRHCLEALASIENTRFAEPGEFSKRAFENGKMDLTEAEGLADLIESETLAQTQQALLQMQGNLKNLYENWRKSLIGLMAQVEAYIDFPDEDLPIQLVANITLAITSLKHDLQTHLEDGRKGELLRNGVHITIVGAPNAGKSTLLNYLSRRDVAIVSEIAGTTRDIIEVHLDIAGYPFTIADTAGLRQNTSDVLEQEGMKRTKERAKKGDLLIALAAIEHGQVILPPDVWELIQQHSEVILLINKIDQGTPTIPEILQKYRPILISGKTGEGVDHLLESLQKFAEQHLSHQQDPVITRLRHRTLLQDTLESLNHFNFDQPIEISSENLRHAAHSLGKITGRIDVEDVLDSLFSQFCIGK